jgi:hypothetical protein
MLDAWEREFRAMCKELGFTKRERKALRAWLLERRQG